MNIELVHAAPAPGRRRRRPPLLIVPGAFTGAWLWKDTFLPWFAGEGYDAFAMSFRGHGRVTPARHRLGLEQFLADVDEAVERIGRPPVLIGNSLGGLVAYEHARQRGAPGLVLLSAVPPDGLLRSLVSLARLDPVSAGKMAGLALFPPLRRLGKAPLGIYSDQVPPDEARATTRRLRGESWRVLAEALARPGQPAGPLNLPVYVVGATGDHIIPAAEVRRTAELLKAPCRIFEGYSHSVSVEPGWEAVAADLAAWIETHAE